MSRWPAVKAKQFLALLRIGWSLAWQTGSHRRLKRPGWANSPWQMVAWGQSAHFRGRPAIEWSLTTLAQELFPDRHADLTVDLIEAARATFGQQGLDRLVARRAKQQTGRYREQLSKASPSLGGKVKALARERSAEGYMAEVVPEKRGSYLLIEHHCPICEAARNCTGLCNAELEVFQKSLGSDAVVERTQHLLSGGERCVYRIRKTE